jgi:two-component system, OmpR family, copper resistance phosphate regulon response regulator CusR
MTKKPMTNLPHLLVVEDEPKVALFLKKGLESQGFILTIAPDGATARPLIETGAFDVLVLDVGLPDTSGLELAQLARARNARQPILMLTAFDTTADKLMGFEAGADDYLAKPFDFLELVARIRALLRRAAALPPANANAGADPPAEILRLADLELDMGAKVARRQGRTIDLTARELALLEYLMRNPGRVLSKVDIAERVWEINFDTGTNTIEVYISYLRGKIDRDSPLKLIHTVHGIGYVMKEK